MESTQPVIAHTNCRWYAYIEQGSYFRLYEGMLLQRPMNKDGTMDLATAEVDWDRGVAREDLPRLQQIAKELAAKN